MCHFADVSGADSTSASPPSRFASIHANRASFLLTPRPDRLVEMIDACCALFWSDFSKLIKHGRGRRIDVTTKEGIGG